MADENGQDDQPENKTKKVPYPGFLPGNQFGRVPRKDTVRKVREDLLEKTIAHHSYTQGRPITLWDRALEELDKLEKQAKVTGNRSQYVKLLTEMMTYLYARKKEVVIQENEESPDKTQERLNLLKNMIVDQLQGKAVLLPKEEEPASDD